MMNGSTTSEIEIVDRVGVAPPKCVGGGASESLGFEPDLPEMTIPPDIETTATRDTSGRAGTDCRPAEDDVAGCGAIVLVKALTIGPTPNPPMPSPANADPIRPLGVVPNACSASFSGWSCNVDCSPRGEVILVFALILLVLDLPRASSCSSSSLVSPLLPGRNPTALAHEMISSLLRDDAEDAINAATGDCDPLRA